jgi:hypothetical protein
MADGREHAEDFGTAGDSAEVHAMPPSGERPAAPGQQRAATCASSASHGPNAPRDAMKIRSHSESHIVELDDGSRWRIFPGDIDATLNWKPETDLAVVPIDDDVSSHALEGGGAKVRVIPAGESWPVRQVKSILKDG